MAGRFVVLVALLMSGCLATEPAESGDAASEQWPKLLAVKPASLPAGGLSIIPFILYDAATVNVAFHGDLIWPQPGEAPGVVFWDSTVNSWVAPTSACQFNSAQPQTSFQYYFGTLTFGQSDGEVQVSLPAGSYCIVVDNSGAISGGATGSRRVSLNYTLNLWPPTTPFGEVVTYFVGTASSTSQSWSPSSTSTTTSRSATNAAGTTISADVEVGMPYALAYYNAFLNTKTPDISLEVTSSKTGQKTFKVRSQYDGYGSSAVNQSTVTGPGGSTHIEQVLPLDLAKIQQIHSATKIPLHYTVEEQIGSSWVVAQEETIMVDVLPADTAALWEWDGKEWRSLAPFLATFVTPTNPAISELITIASDYHSDGQMLGWQCHDCTEAQWQESVGAQVGAIYYALQDYYDIDYANMPGTFNNDRASTQKVNLPAESLYLGSANCIDGVFLFASALERLGIPVAIVLRPSHAYLAFQASPGMVGNDEWAGLETTMVGYADAIEAFEEGGAKLDHDLPMINDEDNDRYWLLNVRDLHDAGFTPLPNA